MHPQPRQMLGDFFCLLCNKLIIQSASFNFMFRHSNGAHLPSRMDSDRQRDMLKEIGYPVGAQGVVSNCSCGDTKAFCRKRI
jgi:hypothetical protein